MQLKITEQQNKGLFADCTWRSTSGVSRGYGRRWTVRAWTVCI